jgi:hypothetical protein
MDVDFIELLATPRAARWRNERTASTVKHYAECFTNDDSWEAVICSTCGQQW